MSTTSIFPDGRLGLGVALAGALIAAALGAEAGATLRMAPHEKSAPPTPQLIVLAEPELPAP